MSSGIKRHKETKRKEEKGGERSRTEKRADERRKRNIKQDKEEEGEGKGAEEGTIKQEKEDEVENMRGQQRTREDREVCTSLMPGGFSAKAKRLHDPGTIVSLVGMSAHREFCFIFAYARTLFCFILYTLF